MPNPLRQFLRSYCLSTTSRRPRVRVLHIEQDGSGRTMCGRRGARFIGSEPDGVEDLDAAVGWPLCEECKAAAGPDIYSLWVDPDV